MDFEQFLQTIVEFINEAREENRSSVLNELAGKIMAYYTVSKKKGELYPALEQALGRDLELYYLVLFTLQFITEDEDCISLMKQLLYREDLDIFVAEGICFQLRNIMFRNISIHTSYVEKRKIQRYLLERYEKEFPPEVSFIPYEERNKKRIVIETDTLLNIWHAPSRIVFDTCRELIKDLGYEVLLLVNVAQMDMERIMQFSLLCYQVNYTSKYTGFLSLQYEDVVIPCRQLLWRRDTAAEMQETLRLLQNWKPLCVWHIGSHSFRHDIYRHVTTVLSMPCTDGYNVSEAEVLVSYVQSRSEGVKEALAYAEQQGQKCLNITRMTKHTEMGTQHSRAEYGIPEDAFVLCVVGNRLDDEVTEPFTRMLSSLVGQIENLYIMVIGECKSGLFYPVREDRVKQLGYCKDLMDVMKLSDLFVNPPRYGGGGGAARAFALEIPVVTLPDCDVYALVGDDFSCDSLEEMEKIIRRYAEEEEFYKAQQEIVRRKMEERLRISNADSYRKMLQQVEEWLQRGEIR